MSDEHDRITLQLPNDRALLGVARVVVGGIAARRSLSFEALDDLQLAVETVLAGDYLAGPSVVIEVTLADRLIELAVGPIDAAAIQGDLAQASDGLGLRVVLGAVTDGVAFAERDGEAWLLLEKRVLTPSPAAHD